MLMCAHKMVNEAQKILVLTTITNLREQKILTCDHNKLICDHEILILNQKNTHLCTQNPNFSLQNANFDHN